MKKWVQLFIVVFLLFPLDIELDQSAFVNEFKEATHPSLINSINSIDLINQSPVIKRFERFEQFSSPINLINLINSLNQVCLDRFFLASFNLIDSINPFNQNTAWSQTSQESEPEGSTQVPKNYVIGSGDVLEIFVWRNEQLSREVVVRPDGKISLPLIQDVQAEGLTVLWLKEEITRRFGEYLENPRVTVIVKQIGSYRVSVLGRVMRPGVYPITGETTLVEAISMAGGFTEWANKRKITVITTEAGEETKLTVNYKKIASGKDPSQNIILKRGDTIIVP